MDISRGVNYYFGRGEGRESANLGSLMTVIKRNRQDSCADLVAAIESLVPLLKDQKEAEAAGVLVEAIEELRGAQAGSADQKTAVAKVLDAFEGDHELISYTFQRESSAGQWTEVEELCQASARVLALARRMQ